MRDVWFFKGVVSAPSWGGFGEGSRGFTHTIGTYIINMNFHPSAIGIRQSVAFYLINFIFCTMPR